MTVTLRTVNIPDFGLPLERPAIPAATYAARCDTALKRSGADWLVVYADREHAANIAFLTGFEPRFEEALLLLGKGGERIVVTGNESISYTPVAGLPGMATMLAQSLSLMAQDRTEKPDLVAVLRGRGSERRLSELALVAGLDPATGDYCLQSAGAGGDPLSLGDLS